MSYDPICGRRVDGDGAPSAEYKKKTYRFCSEACRLEFDRAAQRVRLRDAAKAGALLTSGRVRWGVA